MTTLSFEENRQFWEEFIGLYRDNPCLWDSRTADYKNRRKKAEAYDVLIEKCRQMYDYADRDFVFKKVSSLRASFRRQHRRVKDAIRSGKEPYTTLWYYDLMSFVLDLEEEEYLSASFVPTDENVKDENNETQDSHATLSSGFSEADLAAPVPVKSKKRPSATSKASKREKIEYVELPEQQEDEPLTTFQERSQEMSFGENVSHQLKELSKRQKVIAQKLISEVLYHAQMGDLCESSAVVNP